MIPVTILILALLVVLYRYTTKNFQYWKLKNVLYENPIPLFGNFLPVALRKEHISEFLTRIYNKIDAPYYGVYIFGRPHLVLKDPKLIKNVLIRDFPSFPNRFFSINKKVDPLLANIIVTTKDATWKALRNKITPIFTSAKMKLMLPLMEEVAQDLQTYLKTIDGQDYNLHDLMKRYSVDVISSCSFGINSHSVIDKNSKIKRMSEQILDLSQFKKSLIMACYFFNPSLVDWLQLPLADKEACEYLMKIFSDTYYQRRKDNIRRNDLIDLLYDLKMQETENDQYKLDDLKMSAQALLFFSAGSDTMTSTLSFGLFELAKNQEIQEQLREEIKMKENLKKSFDYETLLQNMPYLDLVIKEIMRKYPLGSFLMREALQDYTVEDTGLIIEAGTPIFIPLYSLHFDEKYFPEPNKFIPERFESDRLTKTMQDLYLPFGNGPRKCLGDRFSMLSMKLALVTVIKDFKVQLSEKTEIPIKINKFSPLFIPQDGTIILKITKIK